MIATETVMLDISKIKMAAKIPFFSLQMVIIHLLVTTEL